MGGVHIKGFSFKIVRQGTRSTVEIFFKSGELNVAARVCALAPAVLLELIAVGLMHILH